MDWLRALAYAVIGGFAAAALTYVTGAVGSPGGFTFSADQVHQLWVNGGGGALLALLGSLQKSPLPPTVAEAQKQLSEAKDRAAGEK